ncbi:MULTISPECIES: antirestriction protein [Morganellaceae]|uniref:Antirestriction protein n=1 Tax=Providencia stuartii ATCC 25827 TaxID=471874 RepID=A0AA86YPH7_PROST|nr:antirestriction protein [Providencia stuartii]EDU57866.1 antirestriction protein [Providencia stuartii ATCC 25827]EDU61840.1 antirestriction protein [Providencia stuartii ATCC 25827]
MQQTPLQDINTHLQADIIPLSARNDFWPTYFNGIKGWQTFEVVIFTTMSQFCEDYHGGYWEYCSLSNGGAFIYPNLNQETLTLFNPHNGNKADVSCEAAGIAVCLMMYSLWSFQTESATLVDRFYQLRDYAAQHQERSAIFHLID